RPLRAGSEPYAYAPITLSSRCQIGAQSTFSSPGMPTATTVPPSRVNRTASFRLSARPTHSKVTSAPPSKSERFIPSSLRAAVAQGGVDAASERFDQDGRLVAQAVRHGVDLRWVGDEHLPPTAAGVRAVPGLQTDLDRALGHVVAEAGPALRAPRARRVDAPH